MPLRFHIGDYVEVKATMVTERSYGKINSAKPWGQSHTYYKKLKRKELVAPLRGWIVGAVRRHEGYIEGEHSEDRDQPYFVHTKSALLWKVAQSMMNTPMEAAEADIAMMVCAGWGPQWRKLESQPMRLGTPWNNMAQRHDQREVMEQVKRDAKGRWLKEKVLPGIVIDVPRF
jgi:hypothetical protein